MIGGASIVLLLLMSLTLKSEAPDSELTWFVFNLSFLVNFPHFLISYQLLYHDFGSKVFSELRFFWAAVLVPLILIAILALGLFSPQPQILGYLSASMYFFVGWHYVKQTFGGITVANALEKFYFSGLERKALKWNLFSLWAISFVIPNVGQQNFSLNGITYQSLNLPHGLLSIAYGSLWASLVFVIYLIVRRYILEGKTPSHLAIICFLAIYAWYLPALAHPAFMHLIPFFHSLQYLLFAYVFRRNKIEATAPAENSPERRLSLISGIYGYILLSALTGGVLMYFLPRFLDSLQLGGSAEIGPTPFYFSFLIFINIHHYFIDNVIWRGDNPEMKQYLFTTGKS